MTFSMKSAMWLRYEGSRLHRRDVIARLARREFVDISTEMAFRFRDVHDHLIRISDDALLFQDRITGILTLICRMSAIA